MRDDSSQVTKVVRQITVIGPCPTGYDYCPGVANNPCQPIEVCENSAALAAAASATSTIEVADTEAPEFTRFLPTAPLLLEYGVNYLSAGNAPFATCANPAEAASAASLVASGANATQLPCAMTAYDEGDDEDVTPFIGVTQVLVSTEKYFSLSQHGTGVIPPGQYVYEHAVTDLDGNEAKETLVINVALRKYFEWDDIEVDTSVWDLDGFQDAFRAYQAENLKEIFETSFPNFFIRGVED